ncbi:MAG: hypothetical protein HC831_16670 [Chloroflexia bacterium]|nr:hypothetical protein [Chloroflexia bacterium]
MVGEKFENTFHNSGNPIFIQSFRGCINTSYLEREIKNINRVNDSILSVKDNEYKDLENLLDISQQENQSLIYELKIAGVKTEAAIDRANAIQSTAEKIKQNTTITIEADPTKNKIK